MDIATAIANYWYEFQGYAALMGWQVDPNPMDSPLFRNFLQVKYPAVYAGLTGTSSGTGGSSTPPTTHTASAMSPVMLGALALGAFVLLSPKKHG